MPDEFSPLVSICVITYNQEKYIAQAIDGVLMQQTDFPIELIIGEDCSPDNTRKICLDYKNKYPDKIKLLLPDKNKGSMRNFIDTMQAANGKYIALCEGDDYWTDPLKLQKQVAFLDKNADFSICFHNVQLLRENTLVDDYVSDVTDIYKLAKGNYMHTPSVVFRKNEKVIDILMSMSHSPVGDYLLHMLNAQYGKIKKLPGNMAVYRLNTGFWSNMDTVIKIKKTFVYVDLLIEYFKDPIIEKTLITSRIKLFKGFMSREFMSDNENVLYFREAVRCFRYFIENLNQLYPHRIMFFKLKIRLLRISMKFEFKRLKNACRNIISKSVKTNLN